jgi:hypothetical protein
MGLDMGFDIEPEEIAIRSARRRRGEAHVAEVP